MKVIYFSLLCFLNMSLLGAQSNPTKTELKKQNRSHLDSIAVSQKLVLNTELKTGGLALEIKGDSINNGLQDLALASKMDSLWRQELYKYNTSAYVEMSAEVIQQSDETVEYPQLSTDTLKMRLAELNAKTPFNIEYNPSLESVIKRYLKTRRQSLERLMSLSEYYFPLFEQELDRQNIPLEIKYLAIVESAFNPRARSRVGATGLWQFMFTTGKQFGLDVSSYVDERSDPQMATIAASKYLLSLHKTFKDWDLALAAYNSGPGNVTKAIRRSGGHTNYWNIRHFLPRETAGYLPAFLATYYIFEYAEEHGFKPLKTPIPYIATDTVRVKKMISLKQVSEVLKVDIEVLRFLNPSYKLDIIPVIKEKAYSLRLPNELMGKFVSHEDSIYAYAKTQFDKREKPLPKYFNQSNRIRYRVRNGDYLGKIAKRYRVRVSQIKRWNGLKNNNLRIGQRLYIYTSRP